MSDSSQAEKELKPHAIVLTEAVERHYLVYAEDLDDVMARRGQWIETASRSVKHQAAMLISADQYDEAIEQFVETDTDDGE